MEENYWRVRTDRLRKEQEWEMDGQKKVKIVQNDGNIDSRKRAVLVLLGLLTPHPYIELTCYSWLKMTYCACLHAHYLRFSLQYVNTHFCSPTSR